MGELTYDMSTGNFSVSVELNDLSCNKSSIDTGDGEGIYVSYPKYVPADFKTVLTTDLANVNWSQWDCNNWQRKDSSQWDWTKSDRSWLQLVCSDNAIAASNFTQKFDFTGEYYHLPTIFGMKEIKKVEINKRFYI